MDSLRRSRSLALSALRNALTAPWGEWKSAGLLSRPAPPEPPIPPWTTRPAAAGAARHRRARLDHRHSPGPPRHSGHATRAGMPGPWPGPGAPGPIPMPPGTSIRRSCPGLPGPPGAMAFAGAGAAARRACGGVGVAPAVALEPPPAGPVAMASISAVFEFPWPSEASESRGCLWFRSRARRRAALRRALFGCRSLIRLSDLRPLNRRRAPGLRPAAPASGALSVAA